MKYTIIFTLRVGSSALPVICNQNGLASIISDVRGFLCFCIAILYESTSLLACMLCVRECKCSVTIIIMYIFFKIIAINTGTIDVVTGHLTCWFSLQSDLLVNWAEIRQSPSFLPLGGTVGANTNLQLLISLQLAKPDPCLCQFFGVCISLNCCL